jgi:hypothetical protein
MSSPNFDYEGAKNAGYSDEEITSFLKQNKPKKSFMERLARGATQFALGAAESAALPYEVAVAPLSIPGGQEAAGELFTSELLNDVYPERAKNLFTDKKDLKEPLNLGVRSLVEKATGADLHPEGMLEKAATWAGFLKNPAKLFNLAKSGTTAKDVAKAIAPTGTEVLRGIGAGGALQNAEEGNYGPIGTMASAIIGDVAGGGVAGVAKGAKRLITEPKQFLAETAAKFVPKEKIKQQSETILPKKEKIDLQKDLIRDFRNSGIQADIGTITDSNLIKTLQSRLAQSGLTGKPLDELRKSITTQIKEEYKALADSLGESRIASMHEAGEIAREGMKSIREADLAATRELYANANKALKENSFVDSRKLANAIQHIEQELKPGSIKSAEQQAVINTLDKVKKDLYTPDGNLKLASVKDLMNNKIALNDIINYEVQGGAKQLLKGIVGELDRAIISHGKDNIPFVKNYVNANKRFSKHAKTFRNKITSQMLNAEDPVQLMNRMNSVQGIRNMENILSKTPEGKKIFDDLRRFKLDKMIGDNLIDSTSQQAKLGTFSKLLEKGNNKDIAKEILAPQAFKRLERLQKNAGKLAEAAQKFYNASQSGVAAIDATIMVQALNGIANLLVGNPWPLLKTSAGIFGAKSLSKLLADPEFLRLTENVILAASKESKQELINAVEMLRPYITQAMGMNEGQL